METKQTIEGEDYLVCRVCGAELKTLAIHIIRVHNMQVSDYRERFGPVPLTCRTTRVRLSESLARSQTNYEALTADEVLERLCELSKTFSPITYPRLQQNGYSYLCNLAERFFGSLPSALEKAGLEPAKFQRWSEERIFEEIRKLEKAGSKLVYDEARETFPALVSAAEKHCGKWSAALRAAGVDVGKHLSRCKRSDDELREDFTVWVEQYGPLNFARLRETGCEKLYLMATRRFGSLEIAARTYGLPFNGRKSLSREAIVAMLEARAMKGMPLNSAAIRKDNHRLLAAMERRWGSHRECLAALGYNVDAINKSAAKLTRERVEQGLKAWVKEHGEVDGVKMRQLKRQLAYGASKLFGSPEAAAQEFGLPCAGVEKPTISKKGVVRRLRARLRKKMSVKVMDLKREDPKLLAAASYHFGSTARAVRLAKEKGRL